VRRPHTRERTQRPRFRCNTLRSLLFLPLLLFPRSASGAQRRELDATARAAFARALLLDPTDGRAYLGVARGHERDGRVDDARAVYDAGTRATAGENAFLWQAWAVLEARQGDTERARQLYDAATVADKRHAAAWHGWGMLEKRAGNYQRARDLFVRGLRLVPDSAPKEFLYQSLGVMAAERGRADEARAHFAAGARTPSGRRSAALWQAWALCEQRDGKHERGRLLYQRALAASPKNRHTWLAWAALEASLGFTARARELFRQGAVLNPRDAALLQAWGRLEASAGRLATARALFERAARAEPGHQPVWQAWGVTEAAAGHADAARALFQRGVWAAPGSRDAARCFQAWGVLEDRAGKPALARQLFKCALRADPGSAPSWLAWAQMEERLGCLARAAELRALCLQQRAEETVGMADTSPGAVEGLLRPLLDKLTELFDGTGAAGAAGATIPAFNPEEGGDPASDALALLGPREGVLGLPGLLRAGDAAAAAAAAAELDAAVAAASAEGEAAVPARVRAVIAAVGGAAAAGIDFARADAADGAGAFAFATAAADADAPSTPPAAAAAAAAAPRQRVSRAASGPASTLTLTRSEAAPPPDMAGADAEGLGRRMGPPRKLRKKPAQPRREEQ
jgi:tetratricopeptide (TPR) repeat protein